MKPILILMTLLAATVAQAEPPSAIALWPTGAPGALGQRPEDIPTLMPYPADRATATGAAMVICPGGAYRFLAPHEGEDYALWLNQHGVTCFVLKYRLGSNGYRHPAMLNDGARAIRWVRAHAADYQIDPHRVGIIGSSAGGHLASTLLTHFDAGDPQSADVLDRQSSRPDLGVLCYAVISMGEFAHAGSKHNLLGDHPSLELVRLLSNELQVTPATPPTFAWSIVDDKTVPVENTLLFAEALQKNKVPYELHIYQHGGHGMGLEAKPPFAKVSPWANSCLAWLRQHGFVKN